MEILLLVLSVTLLYQVCGNKKHFLIETEDNHRDQSMTRDGNAIQRGIVNWFALQLEKYFGSMASTPWVNNL